MSRRRLMQLRIDRTYERLATLLQGTLVPAGAAWRAASGEGRGPDGAAAR